MKKLALIGTIALGVVGAGVFEQAVFTLPTSASPAMQFLDLPTYQKYQEAIAAAVEHGYVDAPEKAEGQKFYPEKSVSRAEFVKMLVTAKKVNVTGEATDEYWYKPYIKAARDAHITDWSEDEGKDFWNAALPREEMAQLSIRAADAMASQNTDPKKWLYLATCAGLIVGVDNAGTLAEKEPTQKVHSVTIIERVLGNVDHPADKHAVNRAELIWHRTNMFTVMPEFVSTLVPKGTVWDSSKMVLETPDGKWKGEIDQIIAIDAADPNDPGWGLLPPRDQLQWYKKGRYVKDVPDSYILYFKSHTVFNNDPHTYSTDGNVVTSVAGFYPSDKDALGRGILTKAVGVFLNKDGDLPAAIIPKHGETIGSFGIAISAPAFVGHDDARKILIESRVPEKM